MRRHAAAGLLAVSALGAVACATPSAYTLVEPGPRTLLGAYTIQSQVAWSSWRPFGRGQPETWTIDGVALQWLRFFEGTEEGQSLLGSGTAEDRRPRFHASMARAELPEFIADSLFGSLFRIRTVRPVRFGTAPGVRFEVSYAAADGVKREALVTGAVVEGRLYVIVYGGTALHHFGKHRDEVERMMDSIRLTSAR